MQNPLRVALIQQTVKPDKAAALADSLAAIKNAAESGAQLVVLPELHCGYYFCQTEAVENFDQADTIPGETFDYLSKAAQSNHIVLVASIFEKRGVGVYHNTALVFEKDGSLAGKYRKMHIPDDPGYYEKFYFTPGDQGFKPVKTSVGTLGVMVCWDQWFPEGARLMALAGADLLIYPTAIGFNPPDSEDEKQRQRDAWITIQRSHAVANGLPVLACNRVGVEIHPESEGIEFWGSSFIAGPQGEFLAQASTTHSQILLADIILKKNEDVRRIWPFLRDRRIDAYEGLLARYLEG